MRCSTWLTVALNALSAYAATTPSRTVAKRWKTDSELFVKAENGQFQVNGRCMAYPYLRFFFVVKGTKKTHFLNLIASSSSLEQTRTGCHISTLWMISTAPWPICLLLVSGWSELGHSMVRLQHGTRTSQQTLRTIAFHQMSQPSLSMALGSS